MAQKKYKTKAQLDAMSSKEIEKYRYRLLSDPSFARGNPVFQYYKELEFYQNVRFKDEVYARYDRWEQESKGKKDLDSKAKALIISFGKDNCYYMGLASEVKEIAKFQYILGIQYVIPEGFIELFENVRTNGK